MAQNAISTPAVAINNIAVSIVPNSFTYTEGFGEQNMRAQSAGGNSVQVVYSDNAESKPSSIKFSLFPTPENITLARQIKTRRNSNVITAIFGDSFSRTFKNAALTNNYEVPLGADTTLDLEFMSDPAV